MYVTLQKLNCQPYLVGSEFPVIFLPFCSVLTHAMWLLTTSINYT